MAVPNNFAKKYNRYTRKVNAPVPPAQENQTKGTVTVITYYLGNGTTEPIIKIQSAKQALRASSSFGPVVGDLRGFFIDSIESVAAGSLTVVNALYTYADGAQWHLDTAGEAGSLNFNSGEGSIVNLGGGANMSGALGTSGDGYDFGMEIGLEGIGNKGTYDDATKIADDIRAIEIHAPGGNLVPG